ncbi:MAG: histidine kinase [Roseburia sp.]|nr:histidine kinase [Roseburia sp.]
MEEKRTLSAQNKMVKILSIFIIPLIILLVSYNMYALDMINDNSVAYGKNMLEIYSQPIASELNTVENYFENIVLNDLEFRRLVYADTTHKAQAKLDDVNTKIKTIYSAALNMAGHILYHSGTEQVKEYYSNSYSYATKKQFKTFLIEAFEESVLLESERWISYEAENNFYLIRFFTFKGTVLMGIYDLNLADVPQAYEENDPDSFIFFANDNRQPLTSRERLKELGIELESGFRYSYMVSGSKQRYLIVEKELSSLNLYMIYVVPYYSWISANNMPIFFILFSILVVLLLLCCMIVIRKFYIVPLQNMVDTMTKVKEGDMQKRIEDDYLISEFSVATKTFNDMLDKIQELKIARYEQELETQRATMLYLQIQIRPHFVLNCLKNVFSLAQEERCEEIQETVIILSQYLRYVLKDNLTLVPVDTELKSVKNYIYLQQMLSHDLITCECMVEEDALSYTLPPLSILTFVENSVKHGRRIGKKFIITIKVNIIADFLNIVILDNGIGFSQEDLEYLNNKKDFSYGNQHIGIQNVLHRFSIVFHGKSEVVFSNAGGAHIEIFIPLEEARENGDGDFGCR